LFEVLSLALDPRMAFHFEVLFHFRIHSRGFAALPLPERIREGRGVPGPHRGLPG
jgi:hypothetical protein